MGWFDRLKSGFRRRPSPAREDAVDITRWIAEPEGVATSVPADDAAFPRFQSSASDQIDHRGEDPLSALRVRLRSAYTPAQPITDRRMFAGRTKVLTSLIRSIEDQRLHTIIYGERGLGKTSLLHVLAQVARDARYLVVYVTCGAGSTFDETFRTIAAGIPLLYHTQYGPTAPESERGDAISTLLGPEPITVRAAEDMLTKVVGTRILVILDEFDRAESDEFRRNIAELIKSLSDRAVRVQLLIAGVAANLNELVTNVPSVQRNIFAMHVPKMTAGEIRELIKNGEGVSGLTFDDPAVHAVVSRAIGLPYLATLLSHRAALVAIDQGRRNVGADDVVEATNDAVDEFRSRISRRSQLQIDTQIKRGLLAPLGALAGASQSTGGAFTCDDISAVDADQAGVIAARALAEKLADAQQLLVAQDEEFGRTYRFMEDTVPSYLWLLSVEGRALDGAETGARRVG